jgi:hypothetical protein
LVNFSLILVVSDYLEAGVKPEKHRDYPLYESPSIATNLFIDILKVGIFAGKGCYWIPEWLLLEKEIFINHQTASGSFVCSSL